MQKKQEKIALARVNFLLSSCFTKGKDGKNIPDFAKLRTMAENIARRAAERKAL